MSHTPPQPARAATPAERLRVAVIGAGAFGRNHLRVLRQLEHAGDPVHLWAVVDPNLAACAAAEAQFNVRGFPTVRDLLAAAHDEFPAEAHPIHAASVCVPTIHHADVALELLAAGVNLLIEKPLAASLDQADAILSAARSASRIVQPGHLERFNPAVTAARPLITQPMFFEVHRLSVFTPRSLDVDVVLDLMIHDLDIVTSLVPSPIREIRAVGLPVLSRNVDIANVRVEFENGCVANFTASRVSTERVRKLRFFQPHQYVSLDFARQDLLQIDVSAAAALDPAHLAALATLAAQAQSTPHQTPGAPFMTQPHRGMGGVEQSPGQPEQTPGAPFMTQPHRGMGGVEQSPGQPEQSPGAPFMPQSGMGGVEHSPAGQHPTPGLSLRKVPTTPGEPLRLEIASFLHAVRTRTAPEVTAEEGRAALALALQINAEIASHRTRTGL